MMIGESNRLGRDGIHYDLFIKVGKIERDPITRMQGPISPAISNGVPVSHTAGTTIISFQRRGYPDGPAVFYFFI